MPGRSRLRLAMAAWALVAFAEISRAECPESGTEPSVVLSVGPRLELRLSDGRRLRLIGLDPAAQTPTDPSLGEAAEAALAKRLVGTQTTMAIIARKPDRWGRFPAYVFSASGEAGVPGGIATAALGLGLARYLAEPDAHRCRDAFVERERRARDGKLGLWRDPYYAVLPVDDSEAFAERSGTIVLAEGRLAEVSPGPYRTMLRFASPAPGSYRSQTLAATILPHTIRKFEAQKVKFESLVGQQLRFRGLLDLRFGPRVELTSPDEIEIVPPNDAAEQPHAN